jgi:integrase
MAIDKNDYPNTVENNLWANNDYTIFFYNFMFEKKRYRGLIDLKDKSAWGKKDRITFAKGELVRIKNEKRDSVFNTEITLASYMEEYWGNVPEGKYKSIRRSHYDRYVKPHIGMKKLVDLRQKHIEDALKKQEDVNLSARTRKQTLEVLNPAMKKAIANRMIQFNPCDGIKIKLPSSKKMVANAVITLSRIHEAIEAEFIDDPFYHALFLFALQGRRRGEIITLRWEDVNFDASYYILRKTKNNEEQKIFLSERVSSLLKEFREDEGWVFQSRRTGTHLVDIRRVTDRMKTRLDDPKFGVHYLRNVMVSAMAEQGLESIHLSGALGHNDPNTIKKYLTMNYLRSSEEASDVIDVIVEDARKKKEENRQK